MCDCDDSGIDCPHKNALHTAYCSRFKKENELWDWLCEASVFQSQYGFEVRVDVDMGFDGAIILAPLIQVYTYKDACNMANSYCKDLDNQLMN